jgi:3-isopropylmalate dehydrogenase
VTSPVGDRAIDMVVVREGTEGPYAGNGGRLRDGDPARAGHRDQPEHRLRRRAGRARRVRPRAGRERRHLTLVHKTNVLVHAGALWKRVFEDVAAEFPDVAPTTSTSTRRDVLRDSPERFDVVVTDNLFGDILTDIGAAIGGGIGLAASGNIDATRTNPSMFEPVHGSAPTSPARARPTRPRRCCRWPCCSSTSGTPTQRAGRARRGRGPAHRGQRAARTARSATPCWARLG